MAKRKKRVVGKVSAVLLSAVMAVSLGISPVRSVVAEYEQPPVVENQLVDDENLNNETQNETTDPIQDNNTVVTDAETQQPEEQLEQAEQEIVVVENNAGQIPGKAKKAAKVAGADIEMNVNATATRLTTPNLVFKCNYCSTVIARAYMQYYGDCYGGADDNTVVRAIEQDYYNSTQIYTILSGLKGGVTNYTITGDAYINHSGSAVCPNCNVRWGTDAVGWRTFIDNFTVAVYDRFTLNYDANGGEGSGTLTERAAQEYYTFDVPTPTKEGATFIGWATNPKAVAVDPNALTVGPSPNDTTKTVYAVWKQSSAPEAPKKEDLYGIMRNFVNIHCVNSKANHPDKQYSTVSGSHEDVSIGEVVYVEDEKAYTCTVTVDGAEYAAYYGYEPSFGTGVTHTLDDVQYKTIVLKWDSTDSKWKPSTPVPVTFNMTCCKHSNVDYTDNGNGTHDGVCSNCNKTVVDDEAHEFVDGVCTKCGAKEPEKPCEHPNVNYVDNGDGTHDGNCADCGQTVVDNETHEFVDGVCTKCGAKEPEKPCKHPNVNYVDNGDGTHDGNCVDCGQTVVDNEAHEFVDGICTKCGAKQPNKPGKPNKPVTPPNPTKPGQKPGNTIIKTENKPVNSYNNYNNITRNTNGKQSYMPKTGEDIRMDIMVVGIIFIVSSLLLLTMLLAKKRNRKL